jgi:hypothetical protein
MANQNDTIAVIKTGNSRKEESAAVTAKPLVEYAILCAIVYDDPTASPRQADTGFLPLPRKNAPSIVAFLSDLGGDEFRIGQEACPINAPANLALQCIGESPQVALPLL